MSSSAEHECRSGECVVFVGAHPDDSEGFAGTAFRLRGRFELHVVDLTRGERGLGADGLADGTTGIVREAEERRACALLGATPHFLCEVNGRCHASEQAAGMLVELFRRLRPRAVFTHWPVDTHADHVQCAAVTMSALDELERAENWRTELYFYEVLPEQTRQFPVLYSVDITDTMDRKVEMLRQYACQNPDDCLVAVKVVQAAARGAARMPPVAYAEVFTTLDGRLIEGGVLGELMEQT